MGLFEDVIVNAKSAANVVGKKAGQMVDISKLRINAADINNEINKRFEALGKVIYEGRKGDGESSELVTECTAAIDELYEQLSAINDQLVELKDRAVCKQCGTENPFGSTFCNKCGHRFEEE